MKATSRLWCWRAWRISVSLIMTQRPMQKKKNDTRGSGRCSRPIQLLLSAERQLPILRSNTACTICTIVQLTGASPRAMALLAVPWCSWLQRRTRAVCPALQCATASDHGSQQSQDDGVNRASLHLHPSDHRAGLEVLAPCHSPLIFQFLCIRPSSSRQSYIWHLSRE